MNYLSKGVMERQENVLALSPIPRPAVPVRRGVNPDGLNSRHITLRPPRGSLFSLYYRTCALIVLMFRISPLLFILNFFDEEFKLKMRM